MKIAFVRFIPVSFFRWLLAILVGIPLIIMGSIAVMCWTLALLYEAGLFLQIASGNFSKGDIFNLVVIGSILVITSLQMFVINRSYAG
tara:strand:- start:175 stop:438 length:264 start_codon:yes stop_codon:yes gene_type:complete